MYICCCKVISCRCIPVPPYMWIIIHVVAMIASDRWPQKSKFSVKKTGYQTNSWQNCNANGRSCKVAGLPPLLTHCQLKTRNGHEL